MSALARYRKPGGFKQLLTLVETSVPSKQKTLMGIVEKEDPRWAKEIQKRLLTFEKILSWPPETVEKVFSFVPQSTWMQALFSMDEARRREVLQSVIQFHGATAQRQIQDNFSILSPSPGEIQAAQLIVIKKLRELQASGEFRPERFDQDLSLEGLDRFVI